MPTTLEDLPSELLIEITSHLETFHVLSRLAQTSKKLHAFVDKDGFRVFVQNRFPTLSIHLSRIGVLDRHSNAVNPISQGQDRKSSEFWKHAAQAMTTLSRNWDRKAFVAQRMYPLLDLAHHSKSERFNARSEQRQQRYRRQQTQTMGFVPVIDSYENWYGGDWDSRKEVVVWGAGARLIMRVKTMGQEAKGKGSDTEKSNREITDIHGHEHRWAKYQENGALEGRDDITSANILPRQSLMGEENIIIGRASGGLAQVSLSTGTSDSNIVASYATDARPVRSATVSPVAHDLLAVCLSDKSLALYPTLPEGQVNPLGEVAVIPPIHKARTWSTRFIRKDRLAVGLGHADEPVHIYDIGRGGLDATAVRKLPLNSLKQNDLLGWDSTSVYSIAPIASSASAGGAEGDIFLTGAYDGVVRLHDLRCAKTVSSTFSDAFNNCAIYSLLALRRERFVAGSALHSMIKIYDLRLPGGKAYYAANAETCSQNRTEDSLEQTKSSQQACCEYHYDAKHRPRSYNMYMSHRQLTCSTSPVYCLSNPSQYSPTFFTGLENRVIQVDVTSVMDKHPDPIYGSDPRLDRQGTVSRKWDPRGDAMNLSLFYNDTATLTMMVQQNVTNLKRGKALKGWDERWTSDL